jgi:EAL domain-containing protein (putative c-di-GMP-specific phosphodiesterase class I)/GGDEF domain-containing protein
MSLFKQIAIVFSLFVTLVISSIMYLNFKSSSDFLQNQLFTISEDTATSLGLSLSMNIPQDDDISTLETIINAIFDRGYYEYIILKDMDGKVLIENKNIIKVKDVPQWFINNVHVKVPEASTQVSNGWVPYGTLSVKIHTGYAYNQLWNSFKDLVNTFFFLTALAMLSIYILLKIILKSLKSVENQAIAITQNSFIIQKKLPFTTEFRHVVIAMNKMVSKVKDIFDQEAQMVKKYNDLLYKDSDTGMGNRKFFSLRLSSLLEQDDLKSSGTVVIFVLNHFAETKKIVGFKELNNYINKLAEIFYESTKGIEERVITRLKDNEFSMILPALNYDKSKEIIDKFLSSANEIKSDRLKEIEEFYIYGGATYYNQEDKQNEILSRADYALSNAKMSKEQSVYFHEIQELDSIVKMGKQEWHKLIQNAIENEGVKLSLQAVKDIDKNIYHEESYLRIMDDKGNIHPARVFIPVLNLLNLSDKIDRKVIQLALENSNKNIAINIATSFIQNISNLRWLETTLKTKGNNKISFEAGNYAITHNLDMFIQFSNIIRKYNCEFGIDNFRISKTNLNYLQELKPSYIKANKTFFFDMQEDAKSSIYNSFKILVNSLDIKLIATSVESQEEVEKLKALGINLMQGRFIQEPSL